MGQAVLPLPLLSMSFVFHRGVASAYPMIHSCCLPLHIVQSPTCPLHAVFCCLALLKASVQYLCSLLVILICFHCSATQFSPLILFLLLSMTISTSPPWCCLKCSIHIQWQRSAFLQVQCRLAQPAKLPHGSPRSSCEFLCAVGTHCEQLEIKGSMLWVESLEGCVRTAWWKHFLQLPLHSQKDVGREESAVPPLALISGVIWRSANWSRRLSSYA